MKITIDGITIEDVTIEDTLKLIDARGSKKVTTPITPIVFKKTIRKFTGPKSRVPWTKNEFEVLLSNPSMRVEDLAEKIPNHSKQAIQTMRSTIRAEIRGDNRKPIPEYLKAIINSFRQRNDE